MQSIQDIFLEKGYHICHRNLNTGHLPASHNLPLMWLIVAYLSACVVDCCISTNAKTTHHTPIWLPHICGFTICTPPPPEQADSIANGR